MLSGREEKFFQIIEQLFKLCERGDFSSGIEYFGMDEGRIESWKVLSALKAIYNNLKEGEGGED